MGGYFHIEYRDGTYKEVEYKTSKAAERAFKNYSKCPEDSAKGWGWDTKYETPTLAQQIRKNKAKLK